MKRIISIIDSVIDPVVDLLFLFLKYAIPSRSDDYAPSLSNSTCSEDKVVDSWKVFKVTESKLITPTVLQLGLSCSSFRFKAGQYLKLHIHVPGSDEVLVRSYSIASPPEKAGVELCIKCRMDQPISRFLLNLSPGTALKATGPFGVFTYEFKPNRNIFFIATGTGIAPFRSILLSNEFGRLPPKSKKCIVGVYSESELLYVEDLKSIKDLDVCYFVEAPSIGWNGQRGRVTDYLRSSRYSYPWKETEFYIAGNLAMITEVQEILKEYGVDDESIHVEK